MLTCSGKYFWNSWSSPPSSRSWSITSDRGLVLGESLARTAPYCSSVLNWPATTSPGYLPAASTTMGTSDMTASTCPERRAPNAAVVDPKVRGGWVGLRTRSRQVGAGGGLLDAEAEPAGVGHPGDGGALADQHPLVGGEVGGGEVDPLAAVGQDRHPVDGEVAGAGVAGDQPGEGEADPLDPLDAQAVGDGLDHVDLEPALQVVQVVAEHERRVGQLGGHGQHPGGAGPELGRRGRGPGPDRLPAAASAGRQQQGQRQRQQLAHPGSSWLPTQRARDGTIPGALIGWAGTRVDRASCEEARWWPRLRTAAPAAWPARPGSPCCWSG